VLFLGIKRLSSPMKTIFASTSAAANIALYKANETKCKLGI